MVQTFFGDQAIPYAVLYDQLGSFMALTTYGTLIIALYGPDAAGPGLRQVVKKIVLFPPFGALILAFLFKPIHYPPIALSLLKLLAATLIPLVMVAVGYQLTFRLDREIIRRLGLGLAVKLIAVPVAALLVCRMMGLEGEAVKVALFETAMPPMVTAGALAINADLSPKLAAAMVGIGIFVSFATLPLFFQFL
jgi:predicted permease